MNRFADFYRWMIEFELPVVPRLQRKPDAPVAPPPAPGSTAPAALPEKAKPP